MSGDTVGRHIQVAHGDRGDRLGLLLEIVGQAVTQGDLGVCNILAGNGPGHILFAGEVAAAGDGQDVALSIEAYVAGDGVIHAQAVHGDRGDGLGKLLAVVGQAVAQDNFGIGHILGFNFPSNPIFPAGEVTRSKDCQLVISDVDLRCHIDLEGYLLVFLGIPHQRGGNIRGLLFAVVDQATACGIAVDNHCLIRDIHRRNVPLRRLAAGEVAIGDDGQGVFPGIGAFVVDDSVGRHIQAVHGDRGDRLGLLLEIVGQLSTQLNLGIFNVLGGNAPGHILSAGVVAGTTDGHGVIPGIGAGVACNPEICALDQRAFYAIHGDDKHVLGLLLAVVGQLFVQVDGRVFNALGSNVPARFRVAGEVALAGDGHAMSSGIGLGRHGDIHRHVQVVHSDDDIGRGLGLAVIGQGVMVDYHLRGFRDIQGRNAPGPIRAADKVTACRLDRQHIVPGIGAGVAADLEIHALGQRAVHAVHGDRSHGLGLLPAVVGQAATQGDIGIRQASGLNLPGNFHGAGEAALAGDGHGVASRVGGGVAGELVIQRHTVMLWNAAVWDLPL